MSSKSFDSLHLIARAEEALKQRLATHRNYTRDEIEDVQGSERHLFPRDFPLSLEATQRFRHLTGFSQFELRPPLIRSHRPLIGPVIVGAKKIAWRVLSALLKDCFRGQQVFNLAVVKDLAVVELQNAKKKALD